MSTSLRIVIVSDTHGELDDRIAREARLNAIVKTEAQVCAVAKKSLKSREIRWS